ncbi:hypothetical protein RRG08_034909 [Elysia crispata]|uniref:Uncharacterized protein n=1 Tax=Elysia crispata TaxID=231223 RepID=A0AAE1D2A2_9GAST|nr:hypothetical protein RRG08_034909 [Elysia crispata]
MPRIWLERCEPIESPRQTDEIRTRRGSSVLSGGYSTVWPRLQREVTKLTALPGVLKASPPTVRMSDHPQVIGEDGAMPETVTIGREAGLKSVWYWKAGDRESGLKGGTEGGREVRRCGKRKGGVQDEVMKTGGGSLSRVKRVYSRYWTDGGHSHHFVSVQLHIKQWKVFMGHS